MDRSGPSAGDSLGQQIGPSSQGLTVLVSPKPAAVDVVFVHGFTGHPRRTWTHKGELTTQTRLEAERDASEHPSKFRRIFKPSSSKETAVRNPVYWPQDLLPATLPNARILTYGYDTNIRHRFDSPISRNTVYDISKDLLVTLEAERREQPSRPLIFVAHSLGGIIVKEMLRKSYGFQQHQIHLHQIYNSTTAIMFFGTPHSGADPRGIIHHVLEGVIKVAGFAVNEQVVNTLLPNSERLRELRDEFSPIAHQKRWIIHSFQEQYGIRALNNNKVVEDISSTLSDPTVEITQHISSDHMEMCRFKGHEDVEYKKVAAALIRMTNAAGMGLSNPDTNPKFRLPFGFPPELTTEERRSYIEALAFPQIDARLLNIKNAHDSTCSWLFEQNECKEWLQPNKIHEHHGLLWVKGKPGAGKSTMMKYALARAREEITDCVIISFFFNARGEALEKSTLGMYRSLLFQLLNAIPVLQDDFIASAYTRQKYGRLREWNTEELKNLLASAVGSLKQQRLACFIDALDECDEDQVRDMVEFLERLGRDTLVNGIGLYVYLSSRHYPHISIKKGKELIMEGQLGHNQDIKKYVESKLNAGSGTLVEEVKAEILERASGVFLWVVLVVQMLNQAYDHGQIYALRKRLREIPTDLDDLFVDILTRDNKNKEELILCLQWILYAQRPLKRAELYFAIISGIETAELMEWNPREVATQDMERFILSCSKGLAETTKTNDRTVQFIHESVRDFLLWRNGLARLQSDLGHNIAGLSHNRLKGCCLRYMEMDMSQQMQKPLSTKALRDLVSRKFPFLEYAVRNLLIHADAAEGYGVSQTDFLARFTSHSWALYPSCGFRILINFDNLLERYKIRHHTAEVTLLYFLAENNLSNLITLHLERDADIDHLGGERYFTPVYAAVVCGQEQALRALLAIDNETSNDHSQHNDKLIPSRTKVHEEGIQFLMQRRQDFASQTCQTLLSSATRLGFESVVKLLLATGKIDVNAVDKDGRTPLSLAAGTKYDGTVKLRGVVKLLLAADNVDINSTDVEGRTALWWAAHADQVYMARLLLDTGRIDLTSKVNFDINMLFQAITQKDDIIAKMLLTMSDVNRKDLNLRNAFGQTPLSAAAQWGCHGIVKLLLATGLVDTDAWDSQGLTPLQLARNWRRDTTVELLEDYQRKKQLSEPKS